MSQLASFSDFMKATKEVRVSDRRTIINDFSQRTYMFKEMLAVNPHRKVFRGGKSIKDDVRLAGTGTFGFFAPNASFSPNQVQTLTTLTADWRFAQSHTSWSEETVHLNIEAATEDQYFNYKRKLEGDARIDHIDGMEAALWAVPDANSMELGQTPIGQQGAPAYSIPTFITVDGGYPSGFSTLHGVAASTNNWANQVSTYDATDVLNELTGLLPAFDDMWLSVMFESPETSEEYYQTSKYRAMKIVTNRDGMNKYRAACRATNDSHVSPQDPAYPNPKFSGIPLKYVSTLDTARLDLANGTAWQTGRPRYFFLNLEYLFPVMCKGRFMQARDPIIGGATQPFSWVMYYVTWYQIFCQSRRRQGYIVPAA